MYGLLDTIVVPSKYLTSVLGRIQMRVDHCVRHQQTSSIKPNPLELSPFVSYVITGLKLNACELQCVPGVPPRPSSKLELEHLGMRLVPTSTKQPLPPTDHTQSCQYITQPASWQCSTPSRHSFCYVYRSRFWFPRQPKAQPRVGK